MYRMMLCAALAAYVMLFGSCAKQEDCSGGRPVNRGAANLSGQWQAVERWRPVSTFPVQGVNRYTCIISTHPGDPSKLDILRVGTGMDRALLAYLDTVTGCITIPRQTMQDEDGRYRVKNGYGAFRGDSITLKYQKENWRFCDNVEIVLTR